MRYLAKREQASWRQRLQRAYNRPTYTEALGALETLHRELEDRNQSAAGSLAEGLAETLTLHRLGLYGVLGRSLKTTNCLESINALVEERCAKVDHWQNSSQRHRWLATALLDIEPRLRKVMGYRHPAHAPYRVEARTEDQHDDVEEESRVSNQEPSRVSTKNGLDSIRRESRSQRWPGEAKANLARRFRVLLLNKRLLRDVEWSAIKPAPLAVRQLPEHFDVGFCPEALTESRVAQEP